MRLRELKREMQSLGINVQGCMDKESLLDLLELQGAAALVQQEQQQQQREEQRQQQFVNAAAGASMVKPQYPAVEPERSRKNMVVTTVPIAVKRGVDQYGVSTPKSKVITIDLELVGRNHLKFLLDTVTEHSMISAKVARAFPHRESLGQPQWMSASAAEEYGMEWIKLGGCWLGALELGYLNVTAVERDLPVPAGVCGILGLDFLQLFDWDFDVKNETARVALPPAGGGPVPFDSTGMRIVPIAMMPTSRGSSFLACNADIRRHSADPRVGDESPTLKDCVCILDLGASFTVCNQAAAQALGIHVDSNGSSKTRDVALQLSLGNGPDGPAVAEAVVSVGEIEVFETLGLDGECPALILGPNVICRRRLIISPRLQFIWLPEKMTKLRRNSKKSFA